jgi:putative transposase
MRKSRPTRLELLFADQPVYFITACAHQRNPVLNNAPVHAAFQDFAQLAASRGVFVGNYVLMPDHLHLFAAFSPDAMLVSPWIKSMKNFLSKTLREQGVPAPHWQKGFFDHVLRSEDSYIEKWNYVACNPVRAGLVEHPEEWPFRGEIRALSIL